MNSDNFKSDKILVVDDSPDNIFLIKTILEEEGYEVSTAENGYKALSKIEESTFDLILLDLMMPGMDGYEVTKNIRENTHLSFVPILLITAHDSPNVAHGLDLGADDFIRKPVTVDELLARVRSLLRLKHSIDERDEIARQREDFVSRLTHDLRTPLVAEERMMILFLEGALGELSPSMQEALTIMARSNSNLLAMVNTLLEVYRFEAGRKTLAFLPVDIPKLIEEVKSELSPLAAQKGLVIKVDVNETAIATKIMGDRLELHRLFTNLVGNAIKFTDNGSITISLEADATDCDRIILKIVDSGQGISPEQQATLFERFRPGSHKRSGSGLGLYLSRRIVEAHKGTIEINSQLGQGSVFRVILPIKQ
ncbi:MAG: hybrid sensor histidine kinase/response regulator [Richelia sp. RM2_1_2]|nr:hybrid sensor histidine kinase/response regulator [Richelia sp. SM1_7_0]NJN07096.1 hybrid sensor histidine kinase/response regulator [Richelia sp. RM1_1_1]NJO30560.1 hybrid sensor histidine kinase/response regulator [Richelia sp. SL_2_1]NJO58446.1 hybrid sensor histidine kinase/response regulator [Richelia sp. RM2_1_2]